MRLLKASMAGLAFEDLGLVGKSYENLKFQSERPNGMIVTTGPTGSGKTTTLYAILNKLNKEETKIITLEDPVEFKIKGLNQSQIDHSKDILLLMDFDQSCVKILMLLWSVSFVIEKQLT